MSAFAVVFTVLINISVDPNFYSKNLMMIGKTHLAMKNYKLATDFLIRARDYPVQTPDDQKVCYNRPLLNEVGVFWAD